MKIRTKGIVHERFEDAPFIGALIIADDCKYRCKNCFNQHLKDLPTIEMDSHEIIEQVKQNPFNKGIILSGLEWTIQIDEVEELIDLALQNGLEVILYSGLSRTAFESRYDHLTHRNMYLKCGAYEEAFKGHNIQHNVSLASTNQEVVKYKGDQT